MRLVLIFGLILISVVVIGGVVYIAQYNSCQDYSSMGIDVQYHFWIGCMANHPKFGWMPTDDYFRTLNINIP